MDRSMELLREGQLAMVPEQHSSWFDLPTEARNKIFPFSHLVEPCIAYTKKQEDTS